MIVSWRIAFFYLRLFSPFNIFLYTYRVSDRYLEREVLQRASVNRVFITFIVSHRQLSSPSRSDYDPSFGGFQGWTKCVCHQCNSNLWQFLFSRIPSTFISISRLFRPRLLLFRWFALMNPIDTISRFLNSIDKRISISSDCWRFPRKCLMMMTVFCLSSFAQ